MSNKIRGVRTPIAGGFLLGRLGNSAKQNGPKGDVGLVPYSAVATKDYVAAFALPYISDGFLLANTSGTVQLPKGISFVANNGYLDYLFGNPAVQGNIIYRDSNANGWKVLAVGTNGQVLQTQGTGANPRWVTDPALTAMPDGDILSNISGGSAAPAANTITATWDHVFGSAQADLYVRGASAWQVLAPGAANTVLISNGASSNLSYSSLTALLDAVFSSTQGAILYRDASAWMALAPGTNGQVLTTQGAAANPKWATASGGSGYPKGSPPTVVQSAKSSSGGNSVTFGVAPTNGNLLVACSASPSASSAGTGWTLLENESSGTDFGLWLYKVAGAGESTTQTPLSGGGASGALVVWELNGQAGTTPIVCATAGHTTGTTTQSGFTGANTWSQAHIPMDAGCIGLAMTVVVSSSAVIQKSKNVGTQDQAVTSGGTRQFVAGHTDLGQTPTVGIILTWNGANSDCKSMAAVVTA